MSDNDVKNKRQFKLICGISHTLPYIFQFKARTGHLNGELVLKGISRFYQGKPRSAQKQVLEEVQGIKIPVFVQIFEKAALEQKNLDSSSSIL